jgi:hypothetical protein
LRIARRLNLLAVWMLAAPLLAAPQGAPRDCPFDPQQYPAAREIHAKISRLAEGVAPSPQARRRSVVPSPIQYPANRNFIDTEIFGAMKRARVRPAPRSSDTEFLRRVTIDLAGRIPRPDEVSEFLADNRADKRDLVIDRLLASEDFNDRWTLWFGDLVQNVEAASDVGQGVFTGRTPYYRWIRESIAARKPYDAMVRELFTTIGDQNMNGPANYYVRLYQENGPPQDTFDNVATQSGLHFLGMPLNCVSCHDGRAHLELVNRGLSNVKRQQLWGMAAFFSGVRVDLVREGERAKFVVNEDPEGAYTLTTTTGNKSPRQPPPGAPEVVQPEYLTGGRPAEGENPRTAYARLLTSDPQFARATVNYLWKEFFGLGLVEPVNNFDAAKLTQSPDEPSHAALVDLLADRFIRSGFDLRALMRLIAQSNAYGLSGRYDSAWSETYTPYFARHYPRRMMAEVLLDAINQATGRQLSADITLHGTVTKAVATPDPIAFIFHGLRQGAFLQDFGQGDRDSNARTAEPSLIQVLSMLNDPMILDGLGNNTFLSRLISRTTDPAEIANEIYMVTLSRPPTDRERATVIAYLGGGALISRARDVQFVLLNKLEFLFY